MVQRLARSFAFIALFLVMMVGLLQATTTIYFNNGAGGFHSPSVTPTATATPTPVPTPVLFGSATSNLTTGGNSIALTLPASIPAGAFIRLVGSVLSPAATWTCPSGFLRPIGGSG